MFSLCQWFLSLLAEKLPQKGNLWQPTLQSFLPLVRSRKLQKGLFWDLSHRKCLQFETVFPCAVLHAHEGAFTGPSCPPTRPHSVAWSSGGSVKVSARLGPSPGGPGQQQHLGPHPGIGEGDWKHWRRSRMWMTTSVRATPLPRPDTSFQTNPTKQGGT